MPTRAELFRKHKAEVCAVAESIFGNFDSDFITIKNRNEEEVRSYLENGLKSAGLNLNTDKYVYIAEVCGDVIIKR